ncbi:hypothetical protein BCR44DRAFT_34849 [Catenaria anguillulae PL171]|uniref:Large ribosomal subunit protein mL46 n=1 Tax=Catenaria anguillulae PL171 TaxID=765915 RepID=A0A1Y2HAS3_9FUNG|nr:hypothetical protein BCR44DRAFT_34849 [Catenaria anguillulae PL171]
MSAAAATTLLRTSTLVVRRPLITATLTPFADAYYKYHAELRQDHSRQVVDEFWTKKGAGGSDARSIEMAVPAPRVTEADKANDVKSLERKLDEPLYLVVKNKGKWELPTGAVEGEEALHEAAQRNVVDSLGKNMELWMVGRVPIGLSKVAAQDNVKTFIHKAHILAGQAKPVDGKGVQDFAWVSKSELPTYLAKETLSDVANLL